MFSSSSLASENLQQPLIYTVTHAPTAVYGLVWLGDAITDVKGILRILYVVYPANLDAYSGSIQALMHCSSQPVGWATEEALRLQFLSLWQTLHTSSHRRALIPTQQGKSISIISSVATTAERIECQESQRRRKWADRRRGEEGVAEGLGELVVDAPVFTRSPFFLPLSPLQLCSSPHPPEAGDYGNLRYVATLSFRGRRSRGC